MTHPLRTTEVRWFQAGPLPPAVDAWFTRLGPRVEAETRTDRYLAPTDDALGLKLREGALEPKRRESVGGLLTVGRAHAAVETWTKWSFPLAADAVPEAGWVEVAKTRRQREVTTGGGRCRLDVSEVTVGAAMWWSVCLEAEGPSDEAARSVLGAGAARWLAADDAPTLPAEAAMGYPAWLRGTGGG